VREWKCPGCNADHDCDINAAINIQKKGITKLMGRVTSSKPIEACVSLALCQLQPEKWEASSLAAESSHGRNSGKGKYCDQYYFISGVLRLSESPVRVRLW